MDDSQIVLNHVDAALHYLTGRGQASHPLVPIYNARALTESLSLDVEGFVLQRCATAMKNFYDPEEVRSVYYPEVEELVKQVTGAVRVVAFEHDVRCAPVAKRGASAVREPVRVVHDDYTEKSAPERIRLYLCDEADSLLRGRYAVINVWRPIENPVEEAPLAVCDARSLANEDLVPTEEGVKHEVYLFNYNSRHCWFYFPNMQNDESLLIKCYDSLNDGRARLTAHSAFDDPTSPPNARPRESIEVRTLVFFE
jgi:hypothetical protein